MLFHIYWVHVSKFSLTQLCCDILYLGILKRVDFQVLKYRNCTFNKMSIFYNWLLILKCFSLAGDVDQFHVFQHQDLSRKHYRHSVLFKIVFYFSRVQTCSRCKLRCDLAHAISHSGLKQKLHLWRNTLSELSSI